MPHLFCNNNRRKTIKSLEIKLKKGEEFLHLKKYIFKFPNVNNVTEYKKLYVRFKGADFELVDMLFFSQNLRRSNWS